MIDWLTLKLPLDQVHPDALFTFKGRAGWILCIDGAGEKLWEKPMRESVRSDSHQLVVEVGSAELMLHGSPARVRAAHNVFGSGDPRECAQDMIRFASLHTGIELTRDLTQWRCTRMDVTQNYDLGSAAEVRQALNYLRHTEGGRYQVRTSSESTYWSSQSSLRSGKAYHKGPHLLYQSRKRLATVSEEEIILADRLLRLELSLKSQYWRERSGKKWYMLTESELNLIHAEYFSQFIGKIEVIQMDNMLERFEQVAKTKGRAIAAYRTWSLLRTIGMEETRASMPKRTWRDHHQIMVDAGLTYADLQARNVVPFKRRAIILGEPVTSFDQMRNKAA